MVAKRTHSNIPTSSQDLRRLRTQFRQGKFQHKLESNDYEQITYRLQFSWLPNHSLYRYLLMSAALEQQQMNLILQDIGGDSLKSALFFTISRKTLPSLEIFPLFVLVDRDSKTKIKYILRTKVFSPLVRPHLDYSHWSNLVTSCRFGSKCFRNFHSACVA